SLGIEGRILKWFYIKANASKHYRLPSFNDLYWNGIGAKGNSNLKPESGWSEEFSLIHKHRLSHLSWDITATAFNRTIENWMIWLPNQTNIWMPENVLKVWSRGLEYKLNTLYTINKFKLHLSAMYNYVLSTNEAVAVYNSTSLKKQLIYVPIQNAQGSVALFYKNSSITYVHTYTGYRYTSSDNLNYLKPFDIANISIAQHFTTPKTDFKLYVQINNVFGKAYQVIAYRPMPLLNYQVGISINFNKPNNKNQ
ncbi:MAG: TonB-dependent receptor, partial [Bacteroidia bacterium]